MKKFIMQEISKGMILILILLSAISVFLEYRYTKERERLDEVKSIYEMKSKNDLISEENTDVFVDSEKLIIILSNIDEFNVIGFRSKEDVVDVEMNISENKDFDKMRKALNKKGYTSYISRGEGKGKWNSLVLTVK